MSTKTQKHFFLTRKKEFQEVELVTDGAYKRVVKFLEGENKGKEKVVHPKGAAWGSMYPRLFETTKKPEDAFIFKGRVLMKFNKESTDLTPNIDAFYRFQPFLVHVIDSINVKENILLTGGTGVGKTTHIEQLAARCNQSLVRVNFNGETRLSDFIGKVHVLGGETKWVDGILPMAMRNGYWLLLDEIDFADPSVLSLLHPVLEDNSQLVLKENKGEVIKPHPNFRIFATANSIGAMSDRASTYTGTNHMNEAFLDRWQVLMIPNLNQKEELRIVKSKTPGIKVRWAKRIVEFAQKIRERNVEGIEFSSDNFSTRKVLSWARKTALLRSPIEGAKLAWVDKLPSSEHEAIIKILQLHFSNTSKKKKEGGDILASLKEDKPKKPRGRPKKTP